MNKIMIVAAVTAAAFATYLALRKKSRKALIEPIARPATPAEKHITNVFARAKKYSM
jgi:hypothetical protein